MATNKNQQFYYREETDMRTTLKASFLFVPVLALAACAGTMQTASVLEAYKKYDREDYQQTLVLIKRAENAKETSSEMKAELTYLKAQTYEKLGDPDKAETLYQYLSEQHGSSQYGYFATKKLADKQKG